MVRSSRRGLFLLGATALPGCAIPLREPAVPRVATGRASVLGLPNERFLLTQGSAPLGAEFAAALDRQRTHRGLGAGAPLPTLDLLAISGGGEDGAFGAGLLTGWTRHGSRPEFSLVTGVSTGALTAPFAFIGPAGDTALRRVYTEVTLADIATPRSVLAALFNDGMADTTPLYRTIAREMDARVVAAVAEGHRQGRLLLIGTTNLDAQVPVIWNVGAIAASGHPGAQALIHRIMLASAAIPGAFPPVLFDVEVDGARHQELHVDGGAVQQAFLYPGALVAERRANARAGRALQPMRAWLIRNGRLDGAWASIDRRTLTIAQRAVATMIAASGFSDSVRLWLNAERDSIPFRMANIGPEFTTEYREPFEQSYMRALFDYGFAQGIEGGQWRTAPPFTS